MSIHTEEENPTNRTSYTLDTDNLSKGGNPFNSVVLQEPSVEEDVQEEEIDDVSIDTDTSSQTEEKADDDQVIDTDSSAEEDDTTPVDGTEETEEGADIELEDSDVNPYFYLQQQLKEDGFIPNETDFGEDVDGMSVYTAYKSKLREDLEPTVRQEVLTELSKSGYNDQDLVVARAIRQGVDPRLLSTVSSYELYAQMPDDSDMDQKLAVVKGMYQTRGFKQEEIDRLVQVDAEDDDSIKNLDKIFKDSKQFFGGKYNDFVTQENQRAETEKQKAQVELQKAKELITSVITKQEVLGEKMTKAQAKLFENAIYKETESVEVQGNKYRATPMQKFLLEFEQNPEMKLLMFKQWMFKDQEKAQIETEAKKKVDNEFLQGYKNRVVKSKKATKNIAVKKKLETNKKTANSYFLDFGPKKD